MTETTISGQTGARADRRARIVWVLCLIYAAVVMVQDVQQIVFDLGRQSGAGDIGATIELPKDMSGYLVVNDVKPGGSLAKAGVRSGERVRLDRSFDWKRRFHAGEKNATLRSLIPRRATAG